MDRSFFRFVTIHASDGRTDGQTAFSSLDRVACNACSAVKTDQPGNHYHYSSCVTSRSHISNNWALVSRRPA